jgi:hypothetical protein
MTAMSRTPPGMAKVIVAGHERSGTHFLINTLVSNFGFAPKRIDSDISSGADFYIRDHFRVFLAAVGKVNGGRIIKEHHHLGFFDGLFDFVRENFIVFYMYRNPADVMCSYWRYVHAAERREGPLTATPGAFMRAPPRGGMLRYQMEQHATVLDRWRSHVDAWTTVGVEKADVTPISYEDLNLDFEATVGRLAARLGMQCPRPIRPDGRENVVVPGPGIVGGFRGRLDSDDIAFIRRFVEPTLRRLDLTRFISDGAENI